MLSVKLKSKDFKMCRGMIKNVMCLRLQRGWSKLIRKLLVSIVQGLTMLCWQSVIKIRR